MDEALEGGVAPQEPAVVEDGGRSDLEARIAERDARIAELEAQVAEAARSAAAAEELRGEIEELKASAAAEREEFELCLAGARSVKAARALLADHGGDVAALREAEPWLFGDGGAQAAPATGTTGLPGAGPADGGDLAHWRMIAGLEDEG